MSDKKSKFPDLGELSSMAGKLFKDVKSSVCEIIEDYKGKRANDSEAKEATADSKPEKKEAPKAPEKAEKPAAKEAKTEEKPKDEKGAE